MFIFLTKKTWHSRKSTCVLTNRLLNGILNPHPVSKHLHSITHNLINMNIYRIYPGLDAFVISGVYLPYLDVIAANEAAALTAAKTLMPGFNTDESENSLNYIALIGKH